MCEQYEQNNLTVITYSQYKKKRKLLNDIFGVEIIDYKNDSICHSIKNFIAKFCRRMDFEL